MIHRSVQAFKKLDSRPIARPLLTATPRAARFMTHAAAEGPMGACTLPLRKLGSQGLMAPAQGLGCMGLTHSPLLSYAATDGEIKTEDSLATLAHALNLVAPNPLLIDTSDFYGPFNNEELLGEAIAAHGRDKFVVTTKCGFKKLDNGDVVVDGTRAHVRAACEASLQRLGIDSIDLYYMHRVDRACGVEESCKELKALMEEGKIKHVGICECSADELRRAHSIVPVSAVQLEWSLWTREHECDVIPAARVLGIGIVAYSPLGRGFLTGAMTDAKALDEKDMRFRSVPRFEEDNFNKNLKLVQALEAEASTLGVTTGQLALAWLHRQGEDVFPIPGTKRIKNLEQNVAAFAVSQSLPEKLLQRLDSLFSPGAVAGSRYTDRGLQLAKNGGL